MPLARIDRNPSGRQLAVFAAAWLVFIGAAGLAARSRGNPRMALALGAAAVALPLAGAASRGAIRAAYVALSYATYPVGLALSYVALAAVYFLVVAPIGLAMRIMGRDPLSRKFDRSARTYWLPRGPRPTSGSYFKQG